MSTISAGTSSGTALVSTGDTTGALVLQTNGTTTALTLGADQTATFAGAVTAPSFSGTSSTATNLAGGSNGTIPYQSAAGTTQMLAVGTAGQVLQTNGVGAPTWVTPSAGAVSFVSSVTASAASTVSFTDLTSTPAYYFIQFDGVISSTGNNVECLLSIDNGATYITSNYRYTFISIASNNNTVIGTSSGVATAILMADYGASTNSNYPSRGIVKLLGAGSPRAIVQYEVTTMTASAVLNHNTGSGMPDTASGVNAIRLRISTGTITGNFRLYSVSKT